MNYTKGKWEVGRTGVDKFEVMSNKRIAIVDKLEDANLISSAPDMYEALKDMTEYLKEACNIQGGDIYDNAIRALSKAKGKSAS